MHIGRRAMTEGAAKRWTARSRAAATGSQEESVGDLVQARRRDGVTPEKPERTPGGDSQASCGAKRLLVTRNRREI